MAELEGTNIHVMDQSDRIYLRQQLPELQFATPYRFDKKIPELQDYFRLYGFEDLASRQPCRYFVGQMRLGAYRCVGHCWVYGNGENAEARPTVLLTHGLFDHAGLFLKLVEELLKNKFSVFLPDFPGHGLSEGDPAEINDFLEYAHVVADSLLVLNQSPLFGPVSLVGQSTGAAAIMRFLLDQAYPVNINKVILLAPLVRPRKWAPVKLGLPLVSLFARNVPRHFSDQNSHDKAFCDFLQHKDILQARHIPVQWVKAMSRWVEWFEGQSIKLRLGNARKQSVPLLIIQGTDDQTVDWEYNISRIQAFFDDSSLNRVIDARHHLVNEDKLWREQVFSALIRFLQDN